MDGVAKGLQEDPHMLDVVDSGFLVNTGKQGVWPAAGSERAVVATEAPLNSKRRTIAAPIPFVPPVTRTRLPLNSSTETTNG
jgi:hypothetical protein